MTKEELTNKWQLICANLGATIIQQHIINKKIQTDLEAALEFDKMAGLILKEEADKAKKQVEETEAKEQ